jgi:hypothetical protein
MGLLDQVLGGATVGLGGRPGGMSPITMALMGLLAYRTMEGKGRLAEMLGRTPVSGAAPASPDTGNPSASVSSGGVGVY